MIICMACPASIVPVQATETPQVEVNKNSLQISINKYQHIHLTKNVCSTFVGSFRINYRICLLPGEYLLERENENGYFFTALQPSLFTTFKTIFGGEKYVIEDGGIWMPKDKDTSPQIYVFSILERTSYTGSSEEEVFSWLKTHPNSKYVEAHLKNKMLVSEDASVSNGLIHKPDNLSPINSGLASGIAGGIMAAAIASGYDSNGLPYPTILSTSLTSETSLKEIQGIFIPKVIENH